MSTDIQNIGIDPELYSFINKRNLPDKSIEIFWHGFKNSIINLHTIINQNKKEGEKIFPNLLTELHDFCNKLNTMQSEEKYEEIKLEIEKYMRWLSRNIVIQHANDYIFNIYLTNMKRWSKWVLNVHDKIKYDWLINLESDEAGEDQFMTFFNIRKYTCDLDLKDTQHIDIIKHMNDLIHKYHPTYKYKNKFLIEEIYRYVLHAKYLKPTLLYEFAKHFPVIADLKKMKIIKESIPENWTLEKLYKKNLLHSL